MLTLVYIFIQRLGVRGGYPVEVSPPTSTDAIPGQDRLFPAAQAHRVALCPAGLREDGRQRAAER